MTSKIRDPQELQKVQLSRLRELVGELRENAFYAPRLKEAGLWDGVESLEHFTSSMPFTLKSELVEDQRLHPPYGTNLTYPLERYVRIHQTSGTSGSPLRWLDTADGWSFMLETWKKVFAAARVTPSDRVFFPFSFGPFLGFWTAFDAAAELGCLVIPGGGLTSNARLQVLADNSATVICCTPTYAIRLGELASEHGIDISSVKKVIVAGEPGGSIDGVRRRIADLWSEATVLDHHGMTEIGPVSYPNPDIPGLLHVNESSYLAEILDPETLKPVEHGQPGELVLTVLGRPGSPILRYRTGDLVRASTRSTEELGSEDLALDGGILARVDDMVVVRGVNLYPSAVERIVRGFSEIAEYRVHLKDRRSMVEVEVEIEPAEDVTNVDQLCASLGDGFQTAFQLRIPVTAVASGSLPRFELKARRWFRREAED